MHWTFYIILTLPSLIYALIPSVTLPHGVVEGGIGTTVNSNSFYKFEGIPYAKPPVNNLRFEPPQDPEPWLGIWKANITTACIQYDHLTRDTEQNYVIHGDEDCLYVNVYTKSLDQNANLDVLFHIHGGALMFGSGAIYGPEIIMEKNLVYVNFNYRLGPLGFLSTEDEVLPGNMGLRDQIKALHWTKRFIKYFGGNPESITVQGFSAGAGSSHLHYFLPESAGLFKAGISHSGSSLNSWMLVEQAKQKTQQLANFVGCPADNSAEIVACLKTKPARQIVQTTHIFQEFLYNPFSPFGVVIDGYWSKNPVLPDHPYKLLQQGKVYDVPWLISYTTSEGLYPTADFYGNDEYLYQIDTEWNKIAPLILDYNNTVYPEWKDVVNDRIKDHYFGENQVTMNTFSIFVKLVTDRLFLTDIEKAARLHASVTKSPVYMYNFNYNGSTSFSNILTGIDKHLGVSHGDDVILVFKLNGLDSLQTEKDKEISEVLLNAITSIMKNRKPIVPGISWTPLPKTTKGSFEMLQITNTGDLKLLIRKFIGQSKFWNKLPLQENEKLFIKKEHNIESCSEDY
ncbi:hypothetical protein GWI33_004409 [Rhynchophorus ferrugineus]|uniref:Carboxylic ester hydrolase n=1 Tax=Rhynchophorus ferrugineus TaxID=354439 RepID=A0A834IN56_RHYFE|nr:hypothetical protein GWI33_004409 [Rhynchophorus ferrugineus]